MKRGRLIVLDGADGCGKNTQTKLLVERLLSLGMKAKSLDFPGYERNFAGKFIGECLAGKHGDFLAVPPKIASVLYAVDRFESREKIERWLSEGYLVILDRYASSNQIHQGAKISDPSDRQEFLEWLDVLEYQVLKIPRPDMVIYLDVPLELSLELLQKARKSGESEKKKRYLEGKEDQAESDIEHLKAARVSAESVAKMSKDWVTVRCSGDGKILPREIINDLIYNEVAEKFKLF
jgi:dTMP kinase